VFVDYPGKGRRSSAAHGQDPAGRGSSRPSLGVPNYTYVEARPRSRATRGPLRSLARPRGRRLGQLKSGVALPCRHEPGLQRTFEESSSTAGRWRSPPAPIRPATAPRRRLASRSPQDSSAPYLRSSVGLRLTASPRARGNLKIRQVPSADDARGRA
jgi:hypothetical protein